jgi:hypothetical protein
MLACTHVPLSSSSWSCDVLLSLRSLVDHRLRIPLLQHSLRMPTQVLRQFERPLGIWAVHVCFGAVPAGSVAVPALMALFIV